MRLSDYSVGRDNNFNLIRFVAAFLVLFSHSFALSTGSADSEPLRTALGTTWGVIAVDVFFVSSGFLVTGSLLARKDLFEFARARFLRIYPGLWVALTVTVVAAGLFVTTLSPGAFFGSTETWKYLAINGSVLKAVYNLPGVFADVPWKHAVNGSLWTLPLEVRMYFALGLLWYIASRLRKGTESGFFLLCCLVAVCAAILNLAEIVSARRTPLTGLGYMFFAGAAIRLFQHRIPASTTLAACMLAAILVAAIDKTAFGIIYSLGLPYLVLYSAFVPGGRLRLFNRFGDYSYGMYIYAFPMQQLLAHLWRGISPYEMVLCSFAATLVLAMLSWHLVEQRALRLKAAVARVPA